MEYRIFRPLLFELVDGKSLEEVLPSLEIVFECGDKQALSEPPWATQKVDMPLVGEFIHQVGLIDIQISVFDNLLEILYSYRVLHKLNCCNSVAKIRLFSLINKKEERKWCV